MTKKEYLSQLEKNLMALPLEERQDIVTEIEERFRVAKEKGEKQSLVMEKLGTPEFLAQSYLKSEGKDEKLDTRSSNSALRIFSKIMLVIALLVLNFCLVLWLWFGVFMTVLGLLIAGGGCLVAGMIWMAAPALVALIPEMSAPDIPQILYFMSGLTVVLFSILGILLVVWFLMWLIKMFIKYVKFNINLVKKV